MKFIGLLLIFSILLFGCNKDRIDVSTPNPFGCGKDDLTTSSPIAYDCLNRELEIIDRLRHCNGSSYEYIILDTIKKIDEQNYSWVPNICSPINSSICYTTADMRTTKLKLVYKNHNLFDDEIGFVDLSNRIVESIPCIKQINETIELKFTGELFDEDTISVKLGTRTPPNPQGYNPKIDYYVLTISHLSGFPTRLFIYDLTNVENTKNIDGNIFHETIELNGVEYKSVVELKSYSGVDAPTRIFVNREFGFFGFAYNNDPLIWTKSHL